MSERASFQVEESGIPQQGARRRSRPPIAMLGLVVVTVALVATGAAIFLITRDEGPKSRAFDARIEALPLGDPTSVVVSGVLEGEPLGRVAVVIQRVLPLAPQPGGSPVPLDGVMLVFSPDGFLGLQVSGTLKLTRNGGEIIDASGTATNGAGDFEGVKGTFTFTGGRSNPSSLYGHFDVFGTLEY